MTTKEILEGKPIVHKPIDTSENVLKKDRSIGELLSMESFADMTDSEIEKVIKFKTDMAVNNELTRTKQAVYIEEMNVLVEQYKNMAKEAADVYKAVLDSQLNLISIDGGNHE